MKTENVHILGWSVQEPQHNNIELCRMEWTRDQGLYKSRTIVEKSSPVAKIG